MRSIVGRGAILGLGILACRFVFYLLAVMLDDTPCGGSQNGVMSGDVADDTANGRPFQASFGMAHGGQRCEADGNDEAGSNLAHFHSPGELPIA